MRGKRDRLVRQFDHRRQVPRWIEIELVDVLVAADRVGRDKDRVTVGLGLGDVFHADIAVGAGAVLDHHRLAQRAGQIVANHARCDIGRTAGRERNDEMDRPVWPVGGRDTAERYSHDRNQGRSDEPCLCHQNSPVIDGPVRLS
jgi:hypothetical protein